MSITAALKGHGTFIYKAKETIAHYGSTERLIAAMRQCRMTHAWVRIHGRNGGFADDPSTRGLVEALGKAGIAVGGWGWCQGEDVDAEAALAIAQLGALGLDTYIADIEEGVNNARWTAAEVGRFLETVRGQLGAEGGLAVSTFGFIDWHAPKLMRAADPHVDAFAPQVYWFNLPNRKMHEAHGVQCNDPVAYTRLCLDRWGKITEKPIVVTGQAYWSVDEAQSFSRTDAEAKLAQFVEEFDPEASGLAGLNWWHFGGGSAMSAAMLAAIRRRAPFAGGAPAPEEEEVLAAAAERSEVPLLASGRFMIDLEASVSLRRGPGSDFEVMASVGPGAEVQALADAPEGDWRHVRTESGDEGWVAQRFLIRAEPGLALEASPAEERPEVPTPPTPRRPLVHWKDSLAIANPQRTMDRARSAMSRGTEYVLGKGGADPLTEITPKCDCSGFVAWAIGIPRELPPGSDQWLQTTTYWEGGGEVGEGLFDRTTEDRAVPGDIYVFPDTGGKQGHMGFVSQVAGGRPTRVIHCSSSNWRTHGDAIRETEPGILASHSKSRLMKVDYTALRAKFGLPEPDDADTVIVDFLTSPLEPLTSPLLAADATLRQVLAGRVVLERTGGPLGGAGALQGALNALAAGHPAYTVDLGPAQHQRGYFGKKTEAALKNFQADHGLPPSGDLDRATLQALDRALAQAPVGGASGRVGELAGGVADRLRLVGRDAAAPLFSVGPVRVYTLQTDPEAFFFQSGMTINADGSPRAYHPSGSPPGLDRLAHAGKPGKWWGIATDDPDGRGKPYLQRAGDPCPGFYVATTSLADASKPRRDPARYVNSEEINFIVLALGMRGGAKMGDLAVVTRGDRYEYAVCADLGPRGKLGEGSIALAKALAIPHDPRRGGTSRGVFYIVFPGSRVRWPMSQAEIDHHASSLFAQWGGAEQVRALFAA